MVATNGADETAGSKPKRFKKMGSIDPDKVPHNTTPINENPTVHPIIIQCSP